MAFRKSRVLARHEKWLYDDIRQKVVNKYCYLGFNFNTQKNSCRQGSDHLAADGRKTVIYFSKAFQKYKESVQVFLHV